MDSIQYEAASADCFGAATQVLIAVAFYKNEHLVEPVLGSLIACAADIAAIGGEVVLYVDSPGYTALDDALDAILPQAQAAFPCRVEHNSVNLGFVRTMNRAIEEAVAGRRNLLLLNSDTQVEPGALLEMARVLRLDHMTGFVNPRSNNATLATLPLRFVPPDRHAARMAYQALARRLPPVSYVPTAVGFCLLISWRVLAEFGGFDEIYGKGYNEENDLVMRAGRCGFRAVLANHAFVWHEGEGSFSSAAVDRSVWEPANRAILDQRYPEYGSHTAAHYVAPETVAEQLLAALLPDAEGRIDIAFDFSSFVAAHNGTFQAGRQLLAVAARVWGKHFRLHVLCSAEVYEFHGYAALGVARADPHGGQIFAAFFRVGQPYDWNVLQRLAMCGAVIGVYMLDTISIDCPQLSSSRLYNMWQFTLEHADLVVTQSRQTQAQLAARFTQPTEAAELVSLHSLDLADYRLPGTGADAPPNDGAQRILVLGNHYHHKYLARTANALAASFADRQIVALGQPRPQRRAAEPKPAVPPLDAAPNLIGVPVGALSDAEIGAHYAASHVVVFPSHAEGFGFPTLNALAARRPVFLRRLPVFEELWEALGRTPNIHFYESTAELIERLAVLPAWVEHVPPSENGAERSAREIKAALDKAMARADYARIVRRVRAVQLVSDLSQTGGPAPVIDSKAAQAARFVAERVEDVAHRLLTMGLIYRVSRRGFRSTRAVWRAVRKGRKQQG